jgi:hypothetical protein
MTAVVSQNLVVPPAVQPPYWTMDEFETMVERAQARTCQSMVLLRNEDRIQGAGAFRRAVKKDLSELDRNVHAQLTRMWALHLAAKSSEAQRLIPIVAKGWAGLEILMKLDQSAQRVINREPPTQIPQS